jgi:hypothetical protein
LLITSSRRQGQFLIGLALPSLLHGGEAFAQQPGLGATFIQQGSADKHGQRHHHKDRNGNHDKHTMSATQFSVWNHWAKAPAISLSCWHDQPTFLRNLC